ncbi:MAG: hypothetical protein HQ592_18590 [Planctomycetes bacterium]|nr:hypothetical protein [Planctomycetota bacterium]
MSYFFRFPFVPFGFANLFGREPELGIPTIALCSFLLVLASTSSAQSQEIEVNLLPRNLEAPFCYLRAGSRSWTIFTRALKAEYVVALTARRKGEILGSGKTLEFAGLSISVDESSRLTINAFAEKAEQPTLPFDLDVSLQCPGQPAQSQTLSIRPAPPPRPISYLADLLDDLLKIFWDSEAGHFRKIEKSGFDQYFRRLQAHGIERLIVWQSPLPFSVDPDYLAAEDWSRYQKQARAILDCEDLTRGMARSGLASWKWMRMTMRLRLMPEFGEMFARSAAEHGIHLTASFRPFEPALTKYYEVPTFDEHGNWLWGFLPAAWPSVNYRPQDLCFANFRTILAKQGRAAEAEPRSIEFTQVGNADKLLDRYTQGKHGLRIVASHFPPIAAGSFVLVRDAKGDFSLKRYRDIAEQAEAHQSELSGFDVSVDGESVRINGLRIPHDRRFLIISRENESTEMIQAAVGRPIIVRSQTGNRLGRINIYRVLDQSDPYAPRTRIAGITVPGSFQTTFQAIMNGIDRLGDSPEPERLAKLSFVVDFGSAWSVEMLDFQRADTRRVAIAQVKMMLAHSAFDEIFINTRTHCQLAATTADDYYGDGGIEPLAHYRLKKIPYRHLGIDLAFAPISLASNPRIVALASKTETLEQLTHWQDNEWLGSCQSPTSPFVWRYERNRAVADGLRQLLMDLEREFPGVRIRAVIPPSEEVIRNVRRDLKLMPKPGGGVYGDKYYGQHIRSSLNHIPGIGEGMAMIDLTGLGVEPVFLGIRRTPDAAPLNLYLRECFHSMARNRGSSFRGPRSFFYEAQETLRAKDRDAAREKRENIIRTLLSHRDEIAEVILYEAANWAYYLPVSDPDQCEHRYLDPIPKGADSQ